MGATNKTAAQKAAAKKAAKAAAAVAPKATEIPPPQGAASVPAPVIETPAQPAPVAEGGTAPVETPPTLPPAMPETSDTAPVSQATGEDAGAKDETPGSSEAPTDPVAEPQSLPPPGNVRELAPLAATFRTSVMDPTARIAPFSFVSMGQPEPKKKG